ncbi:MAG TPA: Hsp70 family protein [Vitreimonas sp.]|jgi:molecular chaperone DnaK (HSP70)|nr:Hsp70 family protein [Vitreimonas sp.]
MTSAREAWALCIDFGTAFSKAAAAPAGAWSRFHPEDVRPLMLSREEGANPFLLDSAVFVDEDRILFGRAALARADALAHKKRQALRSFKTLLSVSDLDRALNTGAPASIDPHRIFPMRDLVVLYLAYLLAATDRAVRADPVLSAVSALERRYAAPAWRSGDSGGLHESVVRLFGEAEALRTAIGDKILSPQGVTLKAVGDALPGALSHPRAVQMGLVFEATAAAAYTSIGLEESASHMIVVDMGAGTTDIAAIARSGGRMEELPDARVTLKQAGDFIDRIIANIVLDANKWARSQDQQSILWRLLMRHMRDIKESLFADGRAMLRHENRTISLSMRDLEKDRDFRDFLKNLHRAYDESMEAVRDSAVARKRRGIQAIAVGGGANAPFVQDLLARRPPRSSKLVIEARPATPEWADAPEFEGNLAPVFPQLSIAIGGALAPDTMLAARSELSPAAAGRSGIPAARD